MNKKVNVEIQEYEDKTSQGGRNYTRFKTSQGWMSAFEKDIIKQLKKKEGEEVRILIAIDEDKGFKNIRKVLDSDEEESEEDGEEDEANKKPKVTMERIVPVKNQQATMWASYAKDIFVKLMDEIKIENRSLVNTKIIMGEAIELIKQAKTAFE